MDLYSEAYGETVNEYDLYQPNYEEVMISSIISDQVPLIHQGKLKTNKQTKEILCRELFSEF